MKWAIRLALTSWWDSIDLVCDVGGVSFRSELLGLPEVEAWPDLLRPSILEPHQSYE